MTNGNLLMSIVRRLNGIKTKIRTKQMIKLDEIDRDFIKDILIKCQAILKLRMTDPDVCEKNRERSREYAKMT